MSLSPIQTETLARALHDALGASGIAPPPPPWRLMGAGLRGFVFNTGEGLLKTVGQGRALGSAEGAARREILALSHLQKAGLPAGLHVPALLDSGSFTAPVAGPNGPLSHWLLLSKVPGLPLSHPRALANRKPEMLGEELGAALARFHRQRAPEPAPGDPAARLLSLARTRLSQPALQKAADALARALDETGMPVFLHGDLHLDNILFHEEDGFGLLDWAECGMGFAEGEFRHFETRPDWRDGLFRGYRAGGGEIDMRRYYTGAAVNAFASYAIEASTHIRTAQRLYGLIDHCLRQAGFEAGAEEV